jgi:hypothetical protein
MLVTQIRKCKYIVFVIVLSTNDLFLTIVIRDILISWHFSLMFIMHSVTAKIQTVYTSFPSIRFACAPRRVIDFRDFFSYPTVTLRALFNLCLVFSLCSVSAGSGYLTVWRLLVLVNLIQILLITLISSFVT